MRRHRTTARGILFPLLAGLLAGVFLVPASGAESTGRCSSPRVPARRQDRSLGQLRRLARDAQPCRHRHGEPLARAGRRGRSGTGLVRRVGSRRLHALPLRSQRDDVHVHPPEQRPHAAQRQPRRVREGRHVRRSERRARDGRRAGRVERGLGRREREPAPALRGPPERWRRRQPLSTPDARNSAVVLREARHAVQPRAPRQARRRRSRNDRRSRSSAYATIRVAAGSTSKPAPWSSRFRRRRSSHQPSFATFPSQRCARCGLPFPFSRTRSRARRLRKRSSARSSALRLARVSPAP